MMMFFRVISFVVLGKFINYERYRISQNVLKMSTQQEDLNSYCVYF